MTRIAIGNDHSAVEMKNEIMDYLISQGYEVINYGTDSTEAFDYPIAGEAVARAITDNIADLGILICGTGVGISLAANKVKGIRAAVCSEPVTARLAREHNHANIIAFGARIVGLELAKQIVDCFLQQEPTQQERHLRRISMISDIENR